MNTSFLILLAASLPSSAGLDNGSPFEQALTDQSAWVVRAQSPASSGALVGSPQEVTTYYQGGYAAPYGGTDQFGNPVTPGYPAPLQDPFAGGGMVQPYMAPGMQGNYYTQGINGPQPQQYGWRTRIENTFIPSSGTSSPNVGNFDVFGVDAQMMHFKPIMGNWTFGFGPQLGYRSLQGPSDPASDMPGGVYRLGLDLLLRTPTVNNWTLELGFDPSLATDFNSSINTDAFLLDGHVVAFWQWTPKFTLALGALYWDRVDNIILPYAGIIWNPNDIWEFQLVFPKPKISAFLGTPLGVPTWLYGSIEYHVEAYEIKPGYFDKSTRVQMADWRAMGGLRWEHGRMTSFVEAGYIFDRKVEYKSIGQNFNVDSGFIGRVGFRY
ncbi:DUF6268 family outer membrane beta-barrel protein [Planctomicrobium sp. SH661]|uniref:DUF6268 family outer membrane beta-barrel protein n=1 Tax=Planctomicrobium sp. SH661 TaxID=3448124 RepID=UPI003F5C4265